jgi:hypothetical protein
MQQRFGVSVQSKSLIGRTKTAVQFNTVMTGLDPVIHVSLRTENMDGRVKPGHDEERIGIKWPAQDGGRTIT